jgi:hypothetical protein
VACKIANTVDYLVGKRHDTWDDTCTYAGAADGLRFLAKGKNALNPYVLAGCSVYQGLRRVRAWQK